MLLRRAAGMLGATAGLGAWRGLGCAKTATTFSTAANNDRPLSEDEGVRQARRQQPSSLTDPPNGLLHDSLSEATYDYRHSQRSASRLRISSLTDPTDYYLNNSMSEGSYGMPRILQNRGPIRHSQGSAANRPTTLQRIVVVNRSPAQAPERLHDSFSAGDYGGSSKGH